MRRLSRWERERSTPGGAPVLAEPADKAEALPTDLVGRIYDEVDLTNPTTVANALHKRFCDDLGLGRCPDCPKS